MMDLLQDRQCYTTLLFCFTKREHDSPAYTKHQQLDNYSIQLANKRGTQKLSDGVEMQKLKVQPSIKNLPSK